MRLRFYPVNVSGGLRVACVFYVCMYVCVYGCMYVSLSMDVWIDVLMDIKKKKLRNATQTLSCERVR